MASQPAAAAAAQTRHGGPRGRPRDRHPRRGRRASGPRRGRRDRDPRAQRHRGLREQPEGQRRGLRRRLVPHRRPGRDGRRRLPQHHRPAEGDHQPRRREGQPARGRRDPDGPCLGGAGGRASACRTSGSARRWRRWWCCTKATNAASASCSSSSPSAWPATRCRRRSCSSTRLPKGATGKLQRIGLAQRIGLGFGSYVSGEF